MAIKRTKKGYIISCDADLCDEQLSVETPSHSWEDVVYDMREHEWKSKKEVDGQWMHLCSHCKHDY